MPGLGAYGGLGGKLSGPDGETARCPGPRVSPAPMSLTLLGNPASPGL